jgi:hypothetical protein
LFGACRVYRCERAVVDVPRAALAGAKSADARVFHRVLSSETGVVSLPCGLV